MAYEYSASIYIQPSFQNYSNNSKPIKTHYAGLMSVQHQKIPTFGKKPSFELGIATNETKNCDKTHYYGGDFRSNT